MAKAPSFASTDQHGNSHALSDYLGQYILLFFYPRDLTPGCTAEVCALKDVYTELQEANVQVLGVSADSEVSHATFSDKYDLPFPLLVDSEKKIIEAYGVWREKSMYGRKYMGIARESFLIGPDGEILKHYEKVKPKTHAKEVLDDVRALQGSSS